MDDPMQKDKKSLPLSGPSAIIWFILYAVIVLPLWLVVLVPLMLVSQTLVFVVKKMCGKKPKISTKDSSYASTSSFGSEDPKKYDLVLFGATGFTGKMAAIYIAKNYGGSKSFRWAIAGRRNGALEEIRNELASIDPSLSTLPIIIADSSDKASLDRMSRSTKVVITSAGPFDLYGSDLVMFCAQNGTHYCDITGETDWVRKMIDKYDEVARASGACIVHHCGHDCVPWDLLVMEVSKALKKKGDILKVVNLYDEITAHVSGGTLATMFHALGDRSIYKSALGFDPLLKNHQGTKSTAKFSVKNRSSLGYSKEYKAWCGPFVMAAVMANCVRRSNAVNGYSDNVTYCESVVYASFFAAFVTLIDMMCLGTALLIPPLKWIMLKLHWLPGPGEGPSEKTMDDGFLKVTAIGTGAAGKKAKAMMYFPTDPGYRDTARMLVEAGLVLAHEPTRVKTGGGVWTPAVCLGEALKDRLVATGSSFQILED